MGHYSYNYLLPEEIVTAIARVITDFAGQNGLQYSLWDHDLPVWIVQGSAGARVNRAEIASVLTASGPLLSFTPEAYEDTWTCTNEITYQTRRLTSPDDMVAHRSQIPVEQLLYPETLRYMGIDGVVRRHVNDAWEQSKQLPLTDIQSWEIAPPPASQASGSA